MTGALGALGAIRRNASQRNASQRKATQRDATHCTALHTASRRRPAPNGTVPELCRELWSAGTVEPKRPEEPP